MKNKQPTIKSSKIHQLLNIKESAAIQAPSVQDIAQAKAILGSSASMGKAEIRVTAGLGACVLLSVIWAVSTANTLEDEFFGVFLMMAGIAAVCANSLIFEVLLKDVKAVQQALTPLKSLETCERALTLSKQVPACNNYRETVLSQGREFLNVDLVLMEKIAADLKASEYQEHSRNVCKELHGVLG